MAEMNSNSTSIKKQQQDNLQNAVGPSVNLQNFPNPNFHFHEQNYSDQNTGGWVQNNWNGYNDGNWSRPPPCFNSPPPPFSPNYGPPRGYQQHRPVNNIWSDPSLFQSRFGGYNNGPPRGGYGQPPFRGGFDQGRGGRGRGGPNHGGWNDGNTDGGFNRGRGRGNQWNRGGQHRPNQPAKNQNPNGFGSNSGGSYDTGGNPNNRPGSQGGKKGKQKKQKVDKRDLPENNVYHCEVCDRGFATEIKYQEHVDQHQKCPAKGCSYMAAPKMVESHYHNQHRTGVAQKIWNIKSLEEIRQWREERKKNFPTKENLDKKKKAAAERRARGEVIREKNFGKMKDSRGERGYRDNFRGRARGRGRGHGKGQGQREQGHPRDWTAEKKADNVVQNSSPNEKAGAKRPAQPNEESATSPKKIRQESTNPDIQVDPLAFLIQECVEGHSDSSNSDDDDDSGNKGTAVLPNPDVRCGGLATLITSYDSDSGTSEQVAADDDKNKEEEAEKEEAEEQTEEPDASLAEKWRKQPDKHHKTPRRTFPPKPRKPSLLEMLLVKEMRHERNVILQCVHHIVKQKFFGIGQRKVTQAAEESKN